MTGPKSNNSQHGLSREQAAALVRDSDIDRWAAAQIGRFHTGEAEPMFTPDSPARDLGRDDPGRAVGLGRLTGVGTGTASD